MVFFFLTRLRAHQHDLASLIPLLGAQIGIAWYLLRWVRRRFSWQILWGTAVFLLGIAAFELLTVAMSTFFSVNQMFPAVQKHQPWMRTVVMLWLFPAAPAFVMFLAYRWLAKRKAVAFSPARRSLVQAAGVAAVATPFIVEGFGALVGRLDFQVREVDLPIKDLHPDLQGLRILQLSDVHLSPYLTEADFARVVDASNELKPHISLMTGDLISSWGDPLDACLRQLARVRSDAPMLGCLGNHETYVNVQEYTKQQGAKLGIRFLRHEQHSLRFGNGVMNFGGIDYRPFEFRGHYLPGVEKLKAPGALNILLSHNPDVFDEAQAQGWDVTLAGHTHGGQVTVEILSQTLNPARMYTRYVSGYYRQGDAMCYVTRGIGTIGIPARVGALPEITLLRLRKA